MILEQTSGPGDLQTALPASVSEDIMEINSGTVMHRSLLETPLRVVGSDGIYLHLEDGRKFLDATGGAAVACLGHNHPMIKAAIVEQMDKVSYCGTIFYSTSAAEELCSLLIKGSDGAMKRAYLCGSGSEAVEAAMKMARQYFVELEGPETKRHRFISRWHSYHGTTLSSLGLGGHVMRRKIYEPGYFAAIRKVCDKHGALFIADEVMSGMGRTGYLHAWQAPDVSTPPDLQTIGKCLSGGYQPVAALLLSHKVVDTLTKGTGIFSHGHTYQAHPIGAAAAAAVQKIIMKPECMENVRKLGAQLEKSLRDKLSDMWCVGDIRGKGLFWTIEFVRDKVTKEPFDPKLQVAAGVHKLGMEEPHMISMYPGTGSVGGTAGDFVILAPPYICTMDEIELIAEKTAGAIKAWFEARPELRKA